MMYEWELTLREFFFFMINKWYLNEQKSLGKKGVQLAEGLKLNAQNLPREDVEVIAKGAFTALLTSMHSIGSIDNSPTNTELERSKKSDDYMYDADWETDQRGKSPLNRE